MSFILYYFFCYQTAFFIQSYHTIDRNIKRINEYNTLCRVYSIKLCVTAHIFLVSWALFYTFLGFDCLAFVFLNGHALSMLFSLVCSIELHMGINSFSIFFSLCVEQHTIFLAWMQFPFHYLLPINTRHIRSNSFILNPSIALCTIIWISVVD